MNYKKLSSSRWSGTLALAVALLGLGTVAMVGLAQPDSRGEGRGRERVETIIIGKFASELELTPEQGEKFYPRFNAFRHSTEGLHQQRQEQQRQLEEMSSMGGGDQSRVAELLDAQERLMQQIGEERRRFLADVSEFLSPQQVSRCALLLDELPRRIREFMQERRKDGPDREGKPRWKERQR